MWAGVKARGVVEQSSPAEGPELVESGVRESGTEAWAGLSDRQGFGGTSEGLIGSRQLISGAKPRPARTGKVRKRKAPAKRKRTVRKRRPAQRRRKPPQRRKTNTARRRKSQPRRQRKSSPRALLPGSVL